MIKQDKCYEEDEVGCYYWNEERQLWINPYGNEVADPQPPPPDGRRELFLI